MSNLNDLLKLAGLAARPEVAQAAPAQAREFKAGIGESQVQEDDVEEGNEFTGAMAKAKAAGHDEFEVDGKKYKVQEAAKPDFLDLDNDGDEEESMADAADDAEVQKESVIEESSDECEVCHETPCVCEQPVVSESPTMDTTQLIHLMKLSGISEEAIQQKLDEWANTPNGVGEVEPTVHGDAYDFAQSVNLSLKRYLDAQDMKVQVAEHKVEKLKSLYEEFKKKK